MCFILDWIRRMSWLIAIFVLSLYCIVFFVSLSSLTCTFLPPTEFRLIGNSNQIPWHHSFRRETQLSKQIWKITFHFSSYGKRKTPLSFDRKTSFSVHCNFRNPSERRITWKESVTHLSGGSCFRHQSCSDWWLHQLLARPFGVWRVLAAMSARGTKWHEAEFSHTMLSNLIKDTGIKFEIRTKYIETKMEL